jgi:hypothetical protein
LSQTLLLFLSEYKHRVLSYLVLDCVSQRLPSSSKPTQVKRPELIPRITQRRPPLIRADAAEIWRSDTIVFSQCRSRANQVADLVTRPHRCQDDHTIHLLPPHSVEHSGLGACPQPCRRSNLYFEEKQVVIGLRARGLLLISLLSEHTLRRATFGLADGDGAIQRVAKVPLERHHRFFDF